MGVALAVEQKSVDMPLVEVILTAEGLTAEQISALIHERTGAVERALLSRPRTSGEW